MLSALGSRDVARADYYDTWDPGPAVAADPKRGQWGWVQAARTNPRLQSVVRRIATDVARQPYQLVEVKPNGDTEVVRNHPANRWLDNPWTFCGGGSFQQLLVLTQAWLDLCGEAFWLVDRDTDALMAAPRGVIPIPPHMCVPVIEPAGDRDVVIWFDLTLPGTHIPERVPASEMVWFRDPSWLDPCGRGEGIAQCLNDEINQDEAAAKYNNAFFRNGATPHTIVSVTPSGSQKVTPEQLRALKNEWKGRHEGVLNAFRTLFIGAETKVTPFSQGQRDMQFIEGRKFLRDAIFQAFQMPPEIMGVVENSNRATAQAAMYLYSLNSILPRMVTLTAAINRQFLQPFFGRSRRLVLAFETPVRETAEFYLQKNKEMFGQGAITRDEYRIAMGVEPVGGELGGQYLIPAGVTPVNSNGTVFQMGQGQKPSERSAVRLYGPGHERCKLAPGGLLYAAA